MSIQTIGTVDIDHVDLDNRCVTVYNLLKNDAPNRLVWTTTWSCGPKAVGGGGGGTLEGLKIKREKTIMNLYNVVK